MKKMKKVLAMMLSFVMVLGMSLTAFAADHKPVSTDSAEITVKGVKAGATVKAFKIAEGDWNDEGFVGYKVLEEFDIADVSNPTAAEITTIANSVNKNDGIALDDKEKNGVYTKELEVGEYLILVTANAENDTTIYNPMVVSVYYSTEKSGDLNDQIGGTVSATDNFVVDGQIAYAKHEDPTIGKVILNPGSGNNKGDDTAIGDDISFEITGNFPNYSDAYTEAEYKITDTLSEGLTINADSIEVTVPDKTAPVKGTDYTVDVTGQVITIHFVKAGTTGYVLTNRGATVKVNYTAQLNGDAGINFDENTNTVYAEYTNNPTTDDLGKTEEKKTYHYTFGIDAVIDGTGSEVTKEVYKVNENGEVKVVEVETDRVAVTGPLPGATFELRKKDGTVVGTTDSAADGSLTFTGLDADEYVLVETKAPDGYSLDATEHSVVITAAYNEDGTLKEYSVVIDKESTSTYKASYDSGEKTITYDKVGSVGIKNTKMASLPSTGGIGTTIFTIGGCIIMIVAAGLFFASRRKKAEN